MHPMYNENFAGGDPACRSEAEGRRVHFCHRKSIAGREWIDMTEKAAECWRTFLMETGRDAALQPYECFAFNNHEEGSNRLLQLVLSGQKKATSSGVKGLGIMGLDMPKEGDLSLVTDWAGNPRCVIETESVAILPFHEITFERARLEGEDDSIESWRENHRDFFTREGETLGYAFSEDMEVAFETFRVVYLF